MHATDCLLCNIVRGERHAETIIETDQMLGIMSSLAPLARGHCVFFAKHHTPNFHDIEESAMAEILLAIRRVIRAMGLENYNILQNNGALAGQTVFHAHVHLIPKWTETDGLRHSGERYHARDQGTVARQVRERLASQN
jgi:diadenosine tetraphosphate (Ap4A) HIT family hydrolase